MTRILVIVAGTNEPSNSNTLADAFAEGATSVPGTDVTKVRLKDFSLPHFTADCYNAACPMPQEYMQLKELVLRADGILIATPIWNFGVPAHLKNFIDWMGCFALDSETKSRGMLQSKPFYFLFTGGAPKAAWKGLMRFTTIFVPEAIRYFGGTIVGKYFEGKCMPARGKFGLVVDQRPESLATVRFCGNRFAAFVERFQKTGRLPFSYRIIERVYRLGQRLAAKF
jgi:NAD(P)H-dependent FMN reductase